MVTKVSDLGRLAMPVIGAFIMLTVAAGLEGRHWGWQQGD